MAVADILMRLATATVDLSTVSTDPSGDGEAIYTVEAGAIARVTEFCIRPSVDIPASSPLVFRFNFRPLDGSGGTLTAQFKPDYFDNADGMKAELGYVVKPNQPGGASKGVCYLGTEDATYSLNIIVAHNAVADFVVDVMGVRVSA